MKIAVVTKDGKRTELGRIAPFSDAAGLLPWLFSCDGVEEVVYVREPEDAMHEEEEDF